ncbi:MAG TPA: hypothetical protein VMB05_11375 [Solirubrobacteraceae bacterium]|nr:hypothetical protein [Solirubrobacteraceae bacterium]
MSRLVAPVALLAGMWVVAMLAPSSAAAASAWWHLGDSARPSVLTPEGEGSIVIQAENVGTATTSGGAETITDVLPPGYSVVESEGKPEVSFFLFSFSEGKVDFGPTGPLGFLNACEVSGRTVSCTTPVSEEFGLDLSPVKPYEYLEVLIKVRLGAGAESGSKNTLKISGGSAPSASTASALPIQGGGSPFGIENFTMLPEDEGGVVDSRAGSHPLQLTTNLTLNQNEDPANPPALLRNVHIELPPGFIGNVNGLPQCTPLDFQHVVTGGTPNLCPPSSVVGVALVTIDEPHNYGVITFPVPVFNLAPKEGEPARFGFELVKTPVILDTSVRTGGDYGVNVDVSNTSELASVLSSTVTLWGVPNDPVHDASRGWGCLVGGYWASVSGQPCVPSTESHPRPFLTLPTACSDAFAITARAQSWPTAAAPSGIEAPTKTFSLEDEFGRALGIHGCNQLSFEPSIEVAPESHRASTPSGYTVRVHMPQEANENSAGLASAAIKSTTVTLPDGVAVNPSAAVGLEACSEGQVGFETIDSSGTALFTPSLPTPFCPEAAKIGTVRLKIPVLPGVLEGGVYLAYQNANPFHSLVAIYVVAEDQTTGVRVKLAGEVSLGPDGQATTSFVNTPQAPIEEAEFAFFGGPHASLGTPPSCGDYATKAVFTPWSGTAAANASSSFSITSGARGEACGPRGFGPRLHAGAASVQAGAFAPFSTTVDREDVDQAIAGVDVHLPAGLSAMIKSVTPCDEARANAGTCGPDSLIGHSTVQVGLGNEPYEVGGGQVFLTGPYRGAPFGLSIVTPAKAGPFDLGLVVVRARLEVDRHTAAVTVATDQTGPYSIPQVLKGIPLDIKRISVNVDRPGFTFNPTNCHLLELKGSFLGGEGGLAGAGAPFQVANCSDLAFAPKFAVSTSAHTSKADGASLSVKLTYPKFAPGRYSNIARVKVELPKRLPSRLTTLHEACLAATFDANPTKCPPRSIVGHAKAVVPNLPVPLQGPAYFVSHGGEAFPDLTMVLQGDNVTIELVGKTFISKKGITSSTFETVPDAPVESFELTLPKGRFSALTAVGKLCGSKLLMPTSFTAQSGREVHQSTKIKVTGCQKPHKKAKKHKRRVKKKAR